MYLIQPDPNKFVIESEKEILVGSKILSLSGVPLGTVDLVNNKIGTVTLYSSPNTETNAELILNNAMQSINVTLRGRGGASFETIIPEDVDVPIGSLVVIPGIKENPIAEVVKIVKRDDTKDKIVYLRSILNFQYLRYVVLK